MKEQCGYKTIKGAVISNAQLQVLKTRRAVVFCREKARVLVFNRRTGNVEKRCEPHAYLVAKESSPEYVNRCSHCGCLDPVN